METVNCSGWSGGVSIGVSLLAVSDKKERPNSDGGAAELRPDIFLDHNLSESEFEAEVQWTRRLVNLDPATGSLGQLGPEATAPVLPGH